MTAAQAYSGLFDRSLRHRIALERFTAGEVRDILRFIQDLEDETVDRIVKLRTPLRRAVTRGERAQADTLDNFLRELRLIYAEGYLELRDRAFNGFDDLAGVEAEFQTGSLQRALDDLRRVAGSGAAGGAAAAKVLTPTADQLSAVVRSRPAEGRLLEDWVADLERGHVARIEAAIRQGFVEGDTIPAITQRVQTVWQINKRGAEAFTRTAVTHVAAEVAQASYEANEDLVPQIEWVSVLDSRTTPICRARDGHRYPLQGGPRPPAHIRCRSTVIPILEDFPPPQRKTYADWLREQSEEQQRDILGPTRFELFTKGKLPLDRFVARDGDPLTIDELRQQDAAAFRRAGIPAKG